MYTPLTANWLLVCFGARSNPLFNNVFQKSLTAPLSYALCFVLLFFMLCLVVVCYALVCVVILCILSYVLCCVLCYVVRFSLLILCVRAVFKEQDPHNIFCKEHTLCKIKYN